MSNAVEIGQNIVALRKAERLSQEQLALRAGMSVSFLRHIEHGRANPSLESLERLAEVLDVDVWVFMLLQKDDKSILSILDELRHTLGAEIIKTVVV